LKYVGSIPHVTDPKGFAWEDEPEDEDLPPVYTLQFVWPAATVTIRSNQTAKIRLRKQTTTTSIGGHSLPKITFEEFSITNEQHAQELRERVKSILMSPLPT